MAVRGSEVAGTLVSEKVAEITSRIERLPLTRWQWKPLMGAGAANFFDAFDAMTIAFVLPVLAGLWHIKPQYIGYLIAAGFLGQLFGAVLFGKVADHYGRLRTTVISIFVFSIFGFCCAAAWSYWSLFTFRVLQGFGLGGEVPVTSTYVNELIMAKTRGKFVMAWMVVFTVGLLAASLVGYWVVPHYGWRILFVIGGLPAILAIYLRLTLPESPRWLASVGRIEEAEKAMAAIERGVQKALGAELPPVVALPIAAKPMRAKFSELFSGIYLKRTITLWIIWFTAFLANYGLTTWLPTLYRTVYKLDVAKSLQFMILTMALGVAGPLLTMVLIDKIGRRLLMGLYFLITGALLLLLWLIGTPTVSQVAIITSFCFFCLASIGCIVYLYTPELYPTRMRALGTGVSSAWLRIASMIGPIITGVVVAGYSLSWAFLLYGSAAVVGGIVTLVFGIETKGRILEDISP